LEKIPVCGGCGTRADSSFAVYELPALKVKLIYCKNCGKVEGVVNL
jgi:ribosomal protein S26